MEDGKPTVAIDRLLPLDEGGGRVREINVAFAQSACPPHPNPLPQRGEGEERPEPQRDAEGKLEPRRT